MNLDFIFTGSRSIRLASNGFRRQRTPCGDQPLDEFRSLVNSSDRSRSDGIRFTGMKSGSGIVALAVVLFLGLLCFSNPALGQEHPPTVQPVTHLLRPDGAPGAHGNSDSDRPRLIEYSPDRGPEWQAAVVIFPGGGYGNLAMDHEGHQIARWFNSIGVSAFICDYRHRGKGYGHPAPRDDAWRAIRWVRAHAGELGIKEHRIGVIGFSAGGHLASTVATHVDAARPGDPDPLNHVSTRPDFAILCYPVIALGEPFTHFGSQRNLLGDNPDPDLIAALSNEKQVTGQTPPTFLWHTANDAVVPVENSIAFFRALRNNDVPGEMHIYESGRHGLGLAHQVPGVKNWTTELEDWLKRRWTK